jgi:hypothetical protein
MIIGSAPSRVSEKLDVSRSRVGRHWQHLAQLHVCVRAHAHVGHWQPEGGLRGLPDRRKAQSARAIALTDQHIGAMHAHRTMKTRSLEPVGGHSIHGHSIHRDRDGSKVFFYLQCASDSGAAKNPPLRLDTPRSVITFRAAASCGGRLFVADEFVVALPWPVFSRFSPLQGPRNMRSPLSLYILLTSLALGLGAGAHHQGRGLGTPHWSAP